MFPNKLELCIKKKIRKFVIINESENDSTLLGKLNSGWQILTFTNIKITRGKRAKLVKYLILPIVDIYFYNPTATATETERQMNGEFRRDNALMLSLDSFVFQGFYRLFFGRFFTFKIIRFFHK